MASTSRDSAQHTADDATDAVASGSQNGSGDQTNPTTAAGGNWYLELDPDAVNGGDEDRDEEEDAEGDDADYEDADEYPHGGSRGYTSLFQDDGDDAMDDDDDFFDPDDDDVDGDDEVDDDDVNEEDVDEEDVDDEDEDDDEEMPALRFGNIEFTITVENSNRQRTAEEQSRPIARLLRAAGAGGWSPRDLMLFLQHPDMDYILSRMEESDGEEYVTSEFNRIMHGTASRPRDPNRFPKVPSVEGTKLMYSGDFGANNHERFPNKSLSRRILERELSVGTWAERKLNKDLITQSLMPSTPADQIIHYEEPVYSGQFSDDGRFFYSCSQDFKIRLYDTTNLYNWKHYKTVSYPWGQWTLTDASLSPDNKWIAYTSHSSLVSIAPTDPRDKGDPYSLDLGVGGTNGPMYGFRSIFSIRFSGDGRELVAGTNGNSLIVYDIESRTVLHNIRGHKDDVNAVCFADKLSPHILYSGSDDATIKVWDRRSMGDEREVGAFVGHTEGLTYIDSKGDGRYVLSNGKDQSMKLWDIRKALTLEQHENLRPFRHRHFDYRMGRYNDDLWDPHPDDNSVVTFRGHQVLQTLIRCHFSPPSSTNSRYVYSGSKDGKVHVWNMDATKAAEIDVGAATRGTRPRDGRTRHYFTSSRGDWATCVRDASWHPHAPFIAASALNGFSMSHGTVSLHSYGEDGEGDGGDEDESERTPRLMMENLQPVPWENKGVGGYTLGNATLDEDDEDDDDDDDDFDAPF